MLPNNQNFYVGLYGPNQVLQAVLYGDSALFKKHPELMEAVVWVYFHSSSAKYNCIECWGPLKDAAQVIKSYV